MAGSISNSNPSRLGGGLPGGQPKGGLLGGGGGTSGGSGMVGGSERGRDRKLLRKAFGRFSVKKSLFSAELDYDDDGTLDSSGSVSGVSGFGPGGCWNPDNSGNCGPITQLTNDILDEDHLYDEHILHNEGSMQAPAQATNHVHKFPLTPFRQAFNAGDSEGTVNNTVLEYLYAPNQVGGTGAGQLIYGRVGGAHKGGGAAYTGNPKYVYDSSDYIRFKKLQAKNRTYNDKSFGGANNGAYVPLMRMRH
jgi:hypothetical protein